MQKFKYQSLILVILVSSVAIFAIFNILIQLDNNNLFYQYSLIWLEILNLFFWLSIYNNLIINKKNYTQISAPVAIVFGFAFFLSFFVMIVIIYYNAFDYIKYYIVFEIVIIVVSLIIVSFIMLSNAYGRPDEIEWVDGRLSMDETLVRLNSFVIDKSTLPSLDLKYYSSISNIINKLKNEIIIKPSSMNSVEYKNLESSLLSLLNLKSTLAQQMDNIQAGYIDNLISEINYNIEVVKVKQKRSY
jgi:hypothetical protein